MARINIISLILLLLVIFIATNANADVINAVVLDKVDCNGTVYVVGSNSNFNLSDNCNKVNSTWECKCTKNIIGNFSEETDLFIQYYLKGETDNIELNKRVFHKTITMPTMISIIEETAVSTFPKLLLITLVSIGMIIILVVLVVVIIPVLKKIAYYRAGDEEQKKETNYKDVEKLLGDIRNGTK